MARAPFSISGVTSLDSNDVLGSSLDSSLDSSLTHRRAWFELGFERHAWFELGFERCYLVRAWIRCRKMRSEARDDSYIKVVLDVNGDHFA